MKKLILIMGVLFIAHVSNAQIFSWGLKGGVNSSKISFDDFNIEEPPTAAINADYYDDIALILTNPALTDEQIAVALANPDFYTITAPQVSFTPSSYELGYHFGAFCRIKVLALFIQPELIFSQANANIDVSGENASGEFVSSVQKLTYNNFEIPVLVGIKLGPARLCAGPVATFNLSSNTDEAEAQIQQGLESFTASTNMATFGGQVGVGLDILKKVTLDVRYAFGLSQLGDDIQVAGETFKTDQRQNQFIASIGWMF